MPLSVKPGYINPLSMMGQKRNGLSPNNLSAQKDKKESNLQNLQMKQQTLQNQILLLKSTTNGAVGENGSQEVLEKQLEEVTAELRTVKSQEVIPAEDMEHSVSNMKRFDIYEKGIESELEEERFPRVYQIDKENGCNVGKNTGFWLDKNHM